MQTSPQSAKADFLSAMAASIADTTFVRLTLGKALRGTNMTRCVATPVDVKQQLQLRIVTSTATKDTTEIVPIEKAITDLAIKIGGDFLSATLFTRERDTTLIYNKRLEPRLTHSKATQTERQPTAHNRAKQYAVDPSQPFLRELGVTTSEGMVKPTMYPKFKQICHFIEIVDDVIRSTPLHTATTISAVDIGSGKGYLTFALYDYLTSRLGKQCTMTGIEARADLAASSNALARRLAYSGLSFEAERADTATPSPVDMVLALHACDTATDDAIFRGISQSAAVIICAPCCQHELAPQLSEANSALRGLMRYGLLRQRQADLVTDAARSLLLEAFGYKSKIIEFVSTEHSGKNLLIVGTKSSDVQREASRRQYEDLKALFGFRSQRLDQLLSAWRS